MASSLSTLIERLDEERQSFVDALDAAPPDLLTSKPSADAWSPLEIAEHVYRTERSVLRGVSKQLDPENERRNIGEPSRARFIALIVALRSPAKFKVPPNAAAVVPGEMAYEEIRADWTSFQAQWESIMANFPTEFESVGLTRHPVSGPMTLGQGLQFLAVHAARHLRQFERALNVLE